MYELKTSQFPVIIPLFKEARWSFPIAQSVIEGRLGGKIFVDNPSAPKTAVVLSKINWMYMYGELNNLSLNHELRDFITNILCSVNDYFVWSGMSEYWQDDLKAMFGNRIKSYPRMPFKFNIQKYAQTKPNYTAIPDGFEIKRIDDSLIEKSCDFFHGILMFWDNYDNFLSNGFGFCALYDGEVVCVCQSAFNAGGLSEIDIFTSDKFRNLGLATHTCSEFIDYCLMNNITPDWDCTVINKPSFNLAKRLGFEETEEYPCFFWHKDFK